MDLTVGTYCMVERIKENMFGEPLLSPIDPYDKNSFAETLERIDLPHVVPPHSRALFYTEDYVKVPDDCFGFIQLRSTWTRLGFLAPATVADPGFEGNLTLAVFNSSKYPLLVRPKDKIWSISYTPVQFSLVRIVDKRELYQGRYQGQVGLTVAKALKRED